MDSKGPHEQHLRSSDSCLCKTPSTNRPIVRLSLSYIRIRPQGTRQVRIGLQFGAMSRWTSLGHQSIDSRGRQPKRAPFQKQLSYLESRVDLLVWVSCLTSRLWTLASFQYAAPRGAYSDELYRHVLRITLHESTYSSPCAQANTTNTTSSSELSAGAQVNQVHLPSWI
ncbi:hypothetical protein CY34DRAFT_721637 [Suillus luteus UH-Slu-Lm8-n1]|uniref:Uncharacterized protein n=1 Tax=Suillus luteus UH-Slu-Lm8-n1 TaxID=930992 RepID=A0A0D0AN33_9AGAM|nr:hypothetical protein CY34DRAFT_721637 [Suillus luteus UH-Slu-Lm8-n1]